ncbi:MAG TPA: serine/threonine-protein kinase, partial [Pirellulales bacterium]|nr:serine/threonine-protein kinase [Pirellulales bacterium]
MSLSLEEFVRDLSASQLLSADEVRAVEAALPPERRPRDAQELAKELVKAGRLTKYQAANAVQGKAKNLVFDDYVVLDTWPAGGSSQLYQAEHRRMKRRVALRLLSPFAAEKSSTAMARFQREVQAAARLEHSHLLAAYHAGEAHGVPYLVLQYVDGQNLDALVREGGPLPWSEAVAYTIQAARALSYAHEKGVVHRDVKPANMLLDSSGVVKISGLGLARIEDDTEKSVTLVGELIGTPEYMSPEQGRDAKH